LTRDTKRNPSSAHHQALVTSTTTPLLHEQILDIKQPVAQFVINTLLQLLAFAITVAFGVYAIRSVRMAVEGNDYAKRANDYADRANGYAKKANVYAERANDYAKRANEYAETALEQARLANQLTLLALCMSVTDNATQTTTSFDTTCSLVLGAARSSLPQMAASLFNASNTAGGGGSGDSSSPASSPPTSTAWSTPSDGSGPEAGSGKSGLSSGAIAAVAVGVTLALLLLLIGVVALLARHRRQRRASHGWQEPSSKKPHGSRREFESWFRRTCMDTRIIARST
jgi:hypothetical protein